MKILFFNIVGSGFSGGGAIDTELISGFLRENGFEVEILCIKDGQNRYIVDRILSAIPTKLFYLRIGILDSLIRAKLRKYIKEMKPNIVDVQDKQLMSAIAGYDIAGVGKVFNIIEEFHPIRFHYLLALSKATCLREKENILLRC